MYERWTRKPSVPCANVQRAAHSIVTHVANLGRSACAWRIEKVRAEREL